MRKFFLTLASLFWASCAFAQAPIQQSGTKLDAATAVAFGQAAVGSASTATITVPSGQYAYITGIGIDLAQNGTSTAVANGNTVAMTNITGTPQWTFSCPATANANCVGVRESFPVPLKSAAPGTNVVLTTGSAAQVQYTVRVYYYLAP